MGNLSKIVDALPDHYGCVIFTGLTGTFINLWMGINVAKARKQYDVPVSKPLLDFSFYLQF